MENIIFYALIAFAVFELIVIAWITKKKNIISQYLEDENIKALRLQGDKIALRSELGLTKLELNRTKNELEKANDKIEAKNAEIKEKEVSIIDHQLEISKRDDKISELQIAASEHETTHNIKAELLKGYEQTISEQSNLLKKQADEITIQKEAIESLTKQLNSIPTQKKKNHKK